MPAAPVGPRVLTEPVHKVPRRGWFDRLIDGLAVAAGVMLCGLTVMICIDAAGRTMLKFPATEDWGYTIPWSLDVAEYTLYLFTFFGAPWVLREGGHIAIDLFVNMLRPTSRRRAAGANHAIGALVCATLFYYSCRVWWTSFREGVLIHETFVFPEWILLSAAPPIFAILAMMFVRWLLWPPERPDAAEPSDGL